MRTAHADDHDLCVTLEPSPSGLATRGLVVAKRSFTIANGGLERAPTAPLVGSMSIDPHQGLVAGSDYGWLKTKTDVVVCGHACAPGATPVRKSEVRCTVGQATKRIAVFGDREVEWSSSGRPYLGAPEPFERIPLDDDHAYGGLDPRFAPPPVSDLAALAAYIAEPPGRYPRNPVGMGYLVREARVDGMALPNLEDPDDLLTDDRLVVGAPEHWHRQPLPWTLGWQHAACFNRYVRLGADAHFSPAAPSELQEVVRGYLPADYQQRIRNAQPMGMHFSQEASLGMSFAPLAPQTPLSLAGCRHDGDPLAFRLPPPPHFEAVLEGTNLDVATRVTSVVIEPDAARVSLVYIGRTSPLPRKFIPGVHQHVPLSVRLDGGPLAWMQDDG